MYYRSSATCALLLTVFAGCKTVHTGDAANQKTSVAMWSDFLAVKKDGETKPAPPELIVDSLKKVGIVATIDDAGLHIAPEDADRAIRALLMDARLKDSGILVWIPVEAGTGRETPATIEFAIPTIPTTIPTTQSSK